MKKKKTIAFITGITGFAGSHLAELLLKKGFEVQGLCRWRSRAENIEKIKDKIHLIEGDLLDLNSLQRAMMDCRPDFIFHLAAQSFVPASWTSPAATLSINVVGSANLFEAVRAAKIDPAIQIACCYDKKTRAFTKDGLKKYGELKKGDKVLSINPKTNEISFKRIKKIIKEDYEGKMYHFKSKSCNLMVTPNHKMLIRKRKGKKMCFVQANKMSGRNLLPMGETKSRKKYFNNDLYYLIGLFIGDGYLVPTKKILKWSGLSHNEYMECRNKKGQFEKIERNKFKEYVSDRAFLAIPKADKSRKKAELTLKKLGIKFSSYDKVIYFVPPKGIKGLLEECGKYAKNKKIPKKPLNSNKEALQFLFKGLIDSDGCTRGKRFSYSTVSKQLVDDMVELCVKIGKWVSVTELREKKVQFKKRIINSSKAYSLSITSGEKILTKTSTTNRQVKQYKHLVWCVEVEDNHNLLVERNGKYAFCGNSSEEYGLVKPNEVPIKEDNPLRPLSPYGVSKIAMDYLGYQYFKSYGMKIVRTRGFNHSGPRRGEPFVCSNFAKQIAEIEKGRREPVMKVGNLSAKRDFTDVRDMVNGYYLAAKKGKQGEVYNICSGKTVEIRKMLEMLLAMSKVKVKVEKDPSRMRPSDVPILWGNCAKFKRQTGWQPKIPFRKTLKDLLDYWRERI